MTTLVAGFGTIDTTRPWADPIYGERELTAHEQPGNVLLMEPITTWLCEEHLFAGQDALAEAGKPFDTDPEESHGGVCAECEEWTTVYPLTRWAD
jgi:hypothetical protein